MNAENDDSAAEDQFRTVSHEPEVDASGDSVPKSEDVTVDGIPRSGRLDSTDIKVGERIGRYELTGILGTGGMGVVFKGHDTALDRDVAIKVLNTNVTVNSKALDRFLIEARAAGKLSHQNVVPIFEIGDSAGIHYLVMEFAGVRVGRQRFVTT
jgi:hypothetical protein